ncbi:hypothetical protein NDU88_006481 [Pleurodeles waltl]|uniref:Phosphoprotein n=1 Tax=Pleurodeles waltl TaxID=8319 RepID=A0AAV7MJZ5_PLEWA|nr:hypothetical protein NDU88_006481 [Pleurodeles waltl]
MRVGLDWAVARGAWCSCSTPWLPWRNAVEPEVGGPAGRPAKEVEARGARACSSGRVSSGSGSLLRLPREDSASTLWCTTIGPAGGVGGVVTGEDERSRLEEGVAAEPPVLETPSGMVRNKGGPMQQSNKMDKYAVPWQTEGPLVSDSAEGGHEKDQGHPVEPSLGAIRTAIQDLRGSLEPKLDVVMVIVTLLRADLKKVAEKVTTAETDIAGIQSTSKRLEEQV